MHYLFICLFNVFDLYDQLSYSRNSDWLIQNKNLEYKINNNVKIYSGKNNELMFNCWVNKLKHASLTLFVIVLKGFVQKYMVFWYLGNS